MTCRTLRTLLCAHLVLVFAGCNGGDDGSGSGSSAGDDNADGGGGPTCADACEALASDSECADQGLTQSNCEMLCAPGACASCLAESMSCGTDCESTCAGAADEGLDDGLPDDGLPDDGAEDGMSEDGADDGADAGSDDGGPIATPCTSVADCPFTEVCVACELIPDPGETYCQDDVECTFSSDCPFGFICGYLNSSSGTDADEGRCIPENLCG